MARLVHADARVALQRSPRTFDVIVGDAFTDITVPEHLVTREFFSLVASRLDDGGIFAMNLLDNVDRLDALASVVVTLREVFPSVEVWTSAGKPERGERRVFVLLASAENSPVSAIDTRAPEPIRFQALDDGFVERIVAGRRARVLTDDYAPLSHLMGLDPVLR
jgi:spermidine synthase